MEGDEQFSVTVMFGSFLLCVFKGIEEVFRVLGAYWVVIDDGQRAKIRLLMDSGLWYLHRSIR